MAETAGRRWLELAHQRGGSLPLLACARTVPPDLARPCRPEIARARAGRNSRAAASARARPCWELPHGSAAGGRPCRLELAHGCASEIAVVSSTASRGDVQGGPRPGAATCREVAAKAKVRSPARERGPVQREDKDGRIGLVYRSTYA